MADEKEKAIVKDQETIKPAGGGKPAGELSEEDLDKAAGGDKPVADKQQDYFRVWIKDA